jgi:hypothetical protein
MPGLQVYAADTLTADKIIENADFVENVYTVNPSTYTIKVVDQSQDYQTYAAYIEGHTTILLSGDSASTAENDKWMIVDHSNWADAASTWAREYYEANPREAFQDGVQDIEGNWRDSNDYEWG